jgi:hypothetical protein
VTEELRRIQGLAERIASVAQQVTADANPAVGAGPAGGGLGPGPDGDDVAGRGPDGDEER